MSEIRYHQGYDPSLDPDFRNQRPDGHYLNGKIVEGFSVTEGQEAVRHQFEQFRQSDLARDSLINQILSQCNELNDKYKLKCKDYDNEVTSRRHYQEINLDLTSELKSLKSNTEKQPFVLALIDGDGAKFREELLNADSEGGSKAANELVTEIKKYIQNKYERASNWSIVVHLYADFESLARVLKIRGMIRATGEFYKFVRAFTANQPLFSFIDVGFGKERADYKIQETFRLFVENTHCKHIIFGGTHDKGYLNTLRGYRHDKSISSRISLMESTPAESEYELLGYPIISFPTVFRKEPLPEPSYITSVLVERSHLGSGTPASKNTSVNSDTADTLPPQYTAPLVPQTLQGQNGSQVLLPVANQTTPLAAVAQIPAPASESSSEDSLTKSSAGQQTVNVPPSQTSSATSNDWATVSRSNTNAKVINIAPNKTAAGSTSKRAMLQNKDGERVDRKLPKVEQQIMTMVNKRIFSKSICNYYQLVGTCPDGINCRFGHGERLNEKEKIALMHKVRELVCSFGRKCNKFECIYGHYCSKEFCVRRNCRFPESDHNVDTKVTVKIFEDGTSEHVND